MISKRFNTREMPRSGLSVILQPIKNLTLSNIKLDKEHPYYTTDGLKAIALDRDEYIKNMGVRNSFHFENLVPIQLMTECKKHNPETLLVPPCFLVEMKQPTKKRKPKRNIAGVLLSDINARINKMLQERKDKSYDCKDGNEES